MAKDTVLLLEEQVGYEIWIKIKTKPQVNLEVNIEVNVINACSVS